MQLADRISINLEAPNSRRLANLAPHKIFLEELLKPLQWADEIRKTQPSRLGWNGKWPSLVTQFVVGAVGENDLEILSTTSYLIKKLRLARTYFSAFNPVTDTPLENHAPRKSVARASPVSIVVPAARLRFRSGRHAVYTERFPAARCRSEDRVGAAESAPTNRSNSTAPIGVNCCACPASAPKASNRSSSRAAQSTLRDLKDLKAIGVLAARAAPFVLLNGRRPTWQLTSVVRSDSFVEFVRFV